MWAERQNDASRPSRLLLIDDDPLIRLLATERLASEG